MFTVLTICRNTSVETSHHGFPDACQLTWSVPDGTKCSCDAFPQLVNVGNGCGVNFIFKVDQKVEIDRIEIQGTRGPRYRPVMPDPLSREMAIQVLTCNAAEMWWSPIMHEPHAYSQLQGNVINHIM
jgi:hypothetical protein